MRRILIVWFVMAIAIAITVWLMADIDVDGGLGTYLWIALIFGLVNALLGPLLRLLTAPLIILTLGLFSLVVNAILLLVTDWLSDSLDVDGFGTALVGSLIISLISTVVGLLVGALTPERV